MRNLLHEQTEGRKDEEAMHPALDEYKRGLADGGHSVELILEIEDGLAQLRALAPGRQERV